MTKELAVKFENQLNKYYLQTIKDLLEEQEINPQQFMHMAVNQIKRNPRLLQVFQNNSPSVFSSILTCAELGLSPASQMGEAWLIPYGKECQFQIGYQGLAKILYKNPDVQNITSECIYENDEFEYELGLTPKLTHKPATTSRGKLIAVYCVVRFANQQPIFKVMTIEELKQIQELSKAGNRSVWFSKTDPQNWMLKKTCFKQLCKLLPKHLNMTKAVAYDNIVEGGGVMRLDDEQNPIVIEKEVKSTANRLEDEIKKDLESKVKKDLKEIDPSVIVGKVIETKVVEENTKKIYTKDEMLEIEEKAEALMELDNDNPSVEHDGMKYNPESPKETLEFTDNIPSPDELIPALQELEEREQIKKDFEEQQLSTDVSDSKSVEL
jgi:recombination protein RecT